MRILLHYAQVTQKVIEIFLFAVDRCDRRETGPEEERGARVVLQPAPEAEAHEVRGAGQLGPVRKRRLGAAHSTGIIWTLLQICYQLPRCPWCNL